MRNVLTSLDSQIMKDVRNIEATHDQKNWQEIERLAHKIKGIALYGTVRLYFAILLFEERYLKAGHTTCQRRFIHPDAYNSGRNPCRIKKSGCYPLVIEGVPL